jgi:putative Mg2+ transporter-C (MgtC) family protein
LNTAATIWCSAAIDAISGLGNPLPALILAVAVLSTNILLRPLAYRLYPAPSAGEEQEVEDEAHMRRSAVAGHVAQSADAHRFA